MSIFEGKLRLRGATILSAFSAGLFLLTGCNTSPDSQDRIDQAVVATLEARENEDLKATIAALTSASEIPVTTSTAAPAERTTEAQNSRRTTAPASTQPQGQIIPQSPTQEVATATTKPIATPETYTTNMTPVTNELPKPSCNVWNDSRYVTSAESLRITGSEGNGVVNTSEISFAPNTRVIVWGSELTLPSGESLTAYIDNSNTLTIPVMVVSENIGNLGVFNGAAVIVELLNPQEDVYNYAKEILGCDNPHQGPVEITVRYNQ